MASVDSLRSAIQDAIDRFWDPNQTGFGLAAWLADAVARHIEETEPTDGGFGARHVGRPGQTVADEDELCSACHGGGYRLVSVPHRAAGPYGHAGIWVEHPSEMCPHCKGTGQKTKPPRERLFFPRAYRRPGGDHWLVENGHGNKRAPRP